MRLRQWIFSLLFSVGLLWAPGRALRAQQPAPSPANGASALLPQEILFEEDGVPTAPPLEMAGFQLSKPGEAERLVQSLTKTGNWKDVSVVSIGKNAWKVATKRVQRVESVEMEGVSGLREDFLRRDLRTQRGQVLVNSWLGFDTKQLIQNLARMGYYNAKVGLPRVQSEGPGRVRVVFPIDRGRPCRVESLSVRPDATFIDRFSLPIETGVICDTQALSEALERSLEKLKSGGYFDAELSLTDLKVKDNGESAVALVHFVKGPRTTIEVFNQDTGAVMSDFFENPDGLTPGEIASLSDDSIKAEVQTILKRRGYAQAFVGKVTRSTQQVAGQKNILILTQPGPLVTIDKVEFIGKMAILPAEMISKIDLNPDWLGRKPPYLEENLDRYTSRIVAIHQQMGYLEASSEPPAVTFSPDGKRAQLTFRVNRGHKWIMGEYTREGRLPPQFQEDSWSLSKKLTPGAEITSDRIEGFKNEYRRQLRKLGYYYANVNFIKEKTKTREINPDTLVANLHFTVEVRELVRFGTIETRGSMFGKEARVIEASGLRTGDLYSDLAREKARSRLMRLDMFSSVEIEPADPKAVSERRPVLDVIISVRPKTGYSFGVNPGYGTNTGYKLGLDNNMYAITSTGTRASIGATFVQNKQYQPVDGKNQYPGASLTLSLAEPLTRFGLWNSPFDTSGTLGVGLSHDGLLPRLFQTAGAGLAWRPIWMGWGVLVEPNLGFESSKILQEDTTPILLLESSVTRILDVGLNLGLDTRNTPIWATEGGTISMGLHAARRIWGTTAQYDHFSLEFSRYLEVLPRNTLAFFAGFSNVSNVENEKDPYTHKESVTPPTSRRIKPVGTSLVRGFPESEDAALGPLLWQGRKSRSGTGSCDATLTRLGATNLVFAKAEYRWRPDTTDNWGFLVFADSGSSYMTSAEAQDISEQLNEFNRIPEAEKRLYGNDPNCYDSQAGFINGDTMAVKDLSFLSQYLKRSFVSAGIGFRYVLENVVGVGLDWGYPLRDPADSDDRCVSLADAKASDVAPVCVARPRKARFALFGQQLQMTIPGAIHLGIQANL